MIRAHTHSQPGTAVTITLRPEKIHIQRPDEPRPDDFNALEGTVRKRLYFGDSLYYELDFDIDIETLVDARIENRPSLPRYAPGDTVVATFHPEAAEALTE